MNYDYTRATEMANIWSSPKELAAALKTAALNLAALDDMSTTFILDMQLAVVDTCRFLEAIEEMGGAR